MTLKKRLARTRRALARAGRIFLDREIASTVDPSRPNTQQQRYFYLGPDLAVMRLATGRLLYVDPADEHVSANIIVHGLWEPHIHRAIQSLLSPGHRVIEVGANVGYHSVEMAFAVGPQGSVTALEANPRMAGLVERSFMLNGYADRARVIAKVAMDKPGTIEFVTSRRNSGGGFVSEWETTPTPYVDSVVHRIEAVALDDLGLDTVDFIRIDAEGSEPHVLRGAARLLQANPAIVVCLEWSVVQMGSRVSVPNFVAWLEGLGFRFWQIGLDSSLVATSGADMLTIGHCDVVLSRSTPDVP